MVGVDGWMGGRGRERGKPRLLLVLDAGMHGMPACHRHTRPHTFIHFPTFPLALPYTYLDFLQQFLLLLDQVLPRVGIHGQAHQPRACLVVAWHRDGARRRAHGGGQRGLQHSRQRRTTAATARGCRRCCCCCACEHRHAAAAVDVDVEAGVSGWGCWGMHAIMPLSNKNIRLGLGHASLSSRMRPPHTRPSHRFDDKEAFVVGHGWGGWMDGVGAVAACAGGQEEEGWGLASTTHSALGPRVWVPSGCLSRHPPPFSCTPTNRNFSLPRFTSPHSPPNRAARVRSRKLHFSPCLLIPPATRPGASGFWCHNFTFSSLPLFVSTHGKRRTLPPKLLPHPPQPTSPTPGFVEHASMTAGIK